MRRFWPLLLLVILAGCGKMQRGWSIEKPPLQYASGPTQTGQTYDMAGLTPEQATYLCHIYGAESPGQAAYSLLGCYNPKMDAVILPDAKYWPSQDELGQMRAHEWGHARGWRHNDDGTGTGLNSLPPKTPPSFGFGGN